MNVQDAGRAWRVELVRRLKKFISRTFPQLDRSSISIMGLMPGDMLTSTTLIRKVDVSVIRKTDLRVGRRTLEYDPHQKEISIR